MNIRIWGWAAALLVCAAPAAHAETDVCAKTPAGTFAFYDQEVSRDAPLPKPATSFTFGKPVYSVACLADAVGPQKAGGKSFRVVMYIKQVNLPDGKYSSYKEGKQEGVYRPEISKSRTNLLVWVHEDFDWTALAHKLDAGDYEITLQAASETGTGKLDLTLDLNPDNPTLYIQELRKAGYLATGKFRMRKP